jgi:hypothetical protein
VKNRAERVRSVLNQPKVEGSYVWLHSEVASFSWRYLCLPDTVDPRGPKTK